MEERYLKFKLKGNLKDIDEIDAHTPEVFIYSNVQFRVLLEEASEGQGKILEPLQFLPPTNARERDDIIRPTHVETTVPYALGP
ncbi:hypothetical protein BYT27DRAFT_7264219 [Phlegmacium glaucopus]|nr:hypothetical protein BYT27DRAFT_7264219 [Phlegmacium glaucopus]